MFSKLHMLFISNRKVINRNVFVRGGGKPQVSGINIYDDFMSNKCVDSPVVVQTVILFVTNTALVTQQCDRTESLGFTGDAALFH